MPTFRCTAVRRCSRRGTRTYVGGALEVLERRADVEIVPVYGAVACSAGPLADSFARLSGELLEALAAAAGAEAVYFALHDAMQAEDRLDPEGWLLERARAIVDPAVPFVMSLDLHGIPTARMFRHSRRCAPIRTSISPTPARARPGCGCGSWTKDCGPLRPGSGCRSWCAATSCSPRPACMAAFSSALKRWRRNPACFSAALFIGNPFTDVPEPGSHAVLVTDGDAGLARQKAFELADGFFDRRVAMQAKLVPFGHAIEAAIASEGPVILTMRPMRRARAPPATAR
jgi:microcystin degradation protein MlrC